VQSAIAAALADPHRLHEWIEEPRLLERYGIDATAIDLSALADFAGLSEKVRHNQCREHLELTFRLLRLSGMEVEFFRRYAPTSRQRRRQGLTTVPDRLEGLAAFVAEWAQQGDSGRTLVRDVLWHEYVIAVLRNAQGPATTEGVGSADPHVTPLHDGRLVVRRTTCNPFQVTEALRAREPDLGAIERGTWTYVYHRAPAGTIRVMEVEDGVAELLLAADGRSSVEEIADRLFGSGELVDSLRSTFDELVRLGLLAWRQPGASPCG
jgi:hypothetical protein